MTDQITTKAAGPGGVDGFEATCSECGLEMASSIRVNLEADLYRHAEWHEAKGGTR